MGDKSIRKEIRKTKGLQCKSSSDFLGRKTGGGSA